MQSIHQRAPYDHMIFKGHTQNTSKFVYDYVVQCSLPPLSPPYVQVSIGYDILENENSHWKLKTKMQIWGILGDRGIHMRSLGDRMI